MRTGLRLIRGRAADDTDIVWAIGRGNRRARLLGTALDDNGALRPEILRRLTEAGLLTEPHQRAYAVTVLPVTACNLGCGYCYQNLAQPQPGSSRPPRIPNLNLRGPRVEAVVDFVARQMAAHGFTTSTLLIFGGEPLLNPEGCIELLTAFRRVGVIHVDMVSNCTLLTGSLAVRLVNAGLRAMQVTYDGGQAAHDTVRVTRTGAGTYTEINERVHEAVAATDLDWSVRVNVSHQNAETLVPLVEDIVRIYPQMRTKVYFSPVFDYGIGYENRLRYTDELAETFVTAGRVLIDAGFAPVFQADTADCVYCGTIGGRTGAVINADGRLYSCWTRCGHEGWEVGDVSSGFRPDEEIGPLWESCTSDIRDATSHEERTRFYDRVDLVLLELQRAHRLATA